MNADSRRLWLLLSPALPIGGYSYSQGLEYAIAAGQVDDFESAGGWIRGLARHMLPKVDLPLLLRMCAALEARDQQRFQHWNLQLLAMRETAELRREDLAMGQALRRLMHELATGTAADAALPAPPLANANVSAEPAFDLPETLTFAAALAFAGSLWSLDADLLSDVCAWIWCENQVAAAIKLVPLGHSDGQRLLLSLADELPALTAQARGLRDQDLGMTATGMALCSAAHETLPARLFRS